MMVRDWVLEFNVCLLPSKIAIIRVCYEGDNKGSYTVSVEGYSCFWLM